MNQQIIQKLKDWRNRKANSEGVDSYLILHNKTIDAIAEAVPNCKEEFIEVKGLGEKKYDKYGLEILAIIKECVGGNPETTNVIDEKKVYSVSDFLNLLNYKLYEVNTGIKGEISSIDFRERYLFFTIKDSEDESCIGCFMWAKDYELSGVQLEEGMEIIAHGFPEIYKKSGKLSFQTQAVELVGEGVLKKKYDELKKKLEIEGLFHEARKKPMPSLPQKIGLITSKDGAVIHDFGNNLGKFGYKVALYDSRVEGIMAVRDLVSAIKYFKDQPIDVLVMIRGGGSLESLQAFNNEALIREIIDYPVPILCGIGHDKDVPLFSLVADKAVSTPTATTRELNKSWEELIVRINQGEAELIGMFQRCLSNYNYLIDRSFGEIKHHYQSMIRIFESFERLIEKISTSFAFGLRRVNEKVDNINTALTQNNPERQLKLGYSITFLNGKVLKSISQTKNNDLLTTKLSDGQIDSQITNRKELP